MKNVKFLLIAFLIVSFFTGCASQKEIVVKTVPVEKTRLELRMPEPINMKNVEWYVITPDNAEAIFESLKLKGSKVVLFGLTDKGYENLAMNMAEIKRYLAEQGVILKAYIEYYEPPTVKTDK